LNRELTGALVFVAVGAAGLFWAADLPFGNASLPGPAMLPTALSVLIVAIAAVQVLRAVRRGARPRAADVGRGLADPGRDGARDARFAPAPPPALQGYRRVALAAALLAVYVPALRPLGFVVATFFCMSALYAIADERPFRLRPLVSGALLTAVTYLLFRILLGVPLPDGTLWK